LDLLILALDVLAERPTVVGRQVHLFRAMSRWLLSSRSSSRFIGVPPIRFKELTTRFVIPVPIGWDILILRLMIIGDLKRRVSQDS
jgi:hypothetical protein